MLRKSMNNNVIQILTILLLFQFSFGAATQGDRQVELDDLGRPLWEADRIWVKLAPGVRHNPEEYELESFGIASLDEKVSRFGVENIVRSFRTQERPDRSDLPDLTRIYTLTLPTAAYLDAVVADLNNDPNVAYAERIPAAYQEAVPNDEYYSQYMYHLPQIMAEEAWDIHKGEDGVEEVVVGICDTGVDWQHPDLGSNIYNRLGEDADGDGQTIVFDGTTWVMDPDDLNGIDDDGNGYIDDLIGWNIVANGNGDQNNDPDDPANRGHGSHCAGLAAGVTNNETGIAAISWNVKVFGTSHGYAGDNGNSIYSAYEGLVYLAENGADIINASWGGGGYSQTAEDIIRYITGLGVIFVSSAGNGDDGGGGMTGFGNAYPSSYPGGISVAAVARTDEKSWYSTFGWAVDIAAPGGNHEPGLISTVPYGDGYDFYSGTSMASPLAAGLFALVKSYHPDWSNDQIINQIIGTTDNIDAENPSYINWLGSGRINAYRALSETGVMVPPVMELERWGDPIVSNPSAMDGILEPGQSTDIAFRLRSYTHILGDSAVTFTLESDDSDVIITNATLQDTIFPDDYSLIEGFSLEISETADTEFSELRLIIQPQNATVTTGDTIYLPLLVNTITVATDFIDEELTFGDVVTDTVTVSNSAGTSVMVGAMAQNLDPASLQWHVDDYRAFDGTSWWCANPDWGGYTDNTFQFMDLPTLDLSGATEPVLNFMVDWDIEDPEGADAPYDGWDGATMFISTDGGDSFEVLEPVTPAYTSTALYSWGEIWGYGLIPGWAGQNTLGYIEAEFDLTDYAVEDVVIRFGFAADGAVNDIGIFVDNITVSDDSNIYFENNGSFGGGIQVTGIPANIVATPWLEFPNANAEVPGNGSLDLEVVTNTRDLTPGSYSSSAMVTFEGVPIAGIDVALTVSAPEHDLYLRQYEVSNGGYGILRSDSVTILVENTGLNTEENVHVAMSLANAEGELFADTLMIASLAPGEMDYYAFAAYQPLKGEDLDLDIQILDVADDYNAWNDVVMAQETVSNLIDTFKDENEFWITEGWGLTTGIIGVTDIYSIHVDAGNIPYGDNLDNTLTFAQPIDLTQVDNLAIVYWTIMQTEEGVDIMSLEVSVDGGSTWNVHRSHSGNNTAWQQHAVDVSEYINAGEEQLWFRFRFTSNEGGAGMGLFLDDVELHTEQYLSTEDVAGVPDEFVLNQNYPNPFNPTTNIRYALPEAVDVKVQVFDLRGRLVSTLVNEMQPAGYYNLTWSPVDLQGVPLGTGMYLTRIQAGDYSKVIKMLYLK